MKVPNWFRIVWWAVLLLLIGSILYARRDDLLAGRAVPADVLIFLVWVALLLVPLFQEVSLFGLKLRQEVKGLKEEVAGLRTEFCNTVDVRAQINSEARYGAGGRRQLQLQSQQPDRPVHRRRERERDPGAMRGRARR